MYKITYKVIKLIGKTVENSRVELTVGGKCLAEVKIRRCIPAVTITICDSDDVTQSLFKKMNRRLQIYKSARKDQPPNVHRRDQTVCQK